MNHRDYADAVDRIEYLALNDFFQSASDSDRNNLGLEQLEVGGAQQFMARHEPNILLNRVIGVGVNRPATREDVTAICDAYSHAGVSDFFLHIQPWIRPAETWNWLFDAGLARDRGWTQFIRGRQPVETRSTTLRVERVGQEYAAEFGRIAAQSFDLSEAAAPVLASMVGLPGWYHYMSFRGDQPAGAAALRVEGDMAWFDWAGTDPAFRGQGSQTALLKQRIETAIELGCRTLVTETGEAVPGDPQHSFRNLMRAGFVPTHTRDNFVPCAAPTTTGRLRVTAA